MSHSATRLRLIKLVHTIAWAFFAGSIVALPICAWARRFDRVLVLAGIVLFEVLVLALNRWSCPLTPIAARYTADRRPNFDIYLPEWLARYSKQVFGTLFVLGLLFALLRWIGWTG